MKKKFMTIVSALLMLTIFLSACGQKDVNGPTPATSQKKNTAEENITIETTEKEKPTKPTETLLETSTEIVSDPTRRPDDPNYHNRKTSVIPAQKALFYSDAKEQELTSEMIRNIINEINEELSENYFQQLKLAVTSEDISELKENNYCIELQYNSTQTIQANCDCIDPPTYSFEKILIVLNGKNENIFFLEKDGVYQNGPIGFANSDLSQDILEAILDD